jgi:hypothetical protein
MIEMVRGAVHSQQQNKQDPLEEPILGATGDPLLPEKKIHKQQLRVFLKVYRRRAKGA